MCLWRVWCWGVHFLGPFKRIVAQRHTLLNEYLNISEPSTAPEAGAWWGGQESQCLLKNFQRFHQVSEDLQHLFDFISGGNAWALTFPVLLERSACRSGSCTDINWHVLAASLLVVCSNWVNSITLIRISEWISEFRIISKLLCVEKVSNQRESDNETASNTAFGTLIHCCSRRSEALEPHTTQPLWQPVCRGNMVNIWSHLSIWFHTLLTSIINRCYVYLQQKLRLVCTNKDQRKVKLEIL